MGFPTKLGLARVETAQAHTPYTRQQVHINVTMTGGLVKSVMRDKRDAFSRGDHEKVKEMKLNETINSAKQNYRNKLERCFQSNNSKGAWQCLGMMTDYKKQTKGIFENIDNENKEPMN